MAEAKQMKVILIRHTLRPEETVALGAKLCYSRSTVEQLKDRVSEKDQGDFIERLMDMGHESVLEHASFTFGIEGVSRALLAQLTRHRLASFSVQSQRYVSYENGFGYVIPPRIRELGEEAVNTFQAQMNMMEQWYREWQNRSMGNPGAGDGNAQAVPGGGPRPLPGRRAGMPARQVPGRGENLRENDGKTGRTEAADRNAGIRRRISEWLFIMICRRTKTGREEQDRTQDGKKREAGTAVQIVAAAGNPTGRRNVMVRTISGGNRITASGHRTEAAAISPETGAASALITGISAMGIETGAAMMTGAVNGPGGMRTNRSAGA